MPEQFLTRVRQLEERLFSDQLDPEDSTRMKNAEYSWLYRPSHHIETGLITEEDIELLSQSGKRLLSVGAHPAYLERILLEIGLPAEAILIADNDARINDVSAPLKAMHFDMTKAWPYMGKFDRIIFPESLCIAIGDTLPEVLPGSHDSDPLEAELLAHILAESLKRLTRGGVIRANGPMSHPNVVQAAAKILDSKRIAHHIDYDRYFLTVTAA